MDTEKRAYSPSLLSVSPSSLPSIRNSMERFEEEDNWAEEVLPGIVMRAWERGGEGKK